ncbi:hypothetical protein BY458DRAFT_536652 [Sporodiniella umbellata]|nr:hypothetical protein BY458DRAFT_536652 [Sporodiniella umbellata]
MSSNLPWEENKPLSLSELLKQSMRSVETLSGDHSLLEKMTTHLNGLLRHEKKQDNSPAAVFERMFVHAQEAMSSDADRQVLSVLQRQVSSFINVTLGVPLEPKTTESIEKEVERLSLAEAQEEEHSSKWQETKDFYHQIKADLFGPEHTEHERLRQLAEEHYGEPVKETNEESSGESDYEEVEERVPIKSREIGGPTEFQVVRRRQKKKKTTTTYTVCPSRPPRHRPQFHEFHPRRLPHLPEDVYCMPLFFPSEESYGEFHAALASAKRTLHVCVFSLTDNDTADVLSDAYQRGVDVKIITDNDQMDVRKGADVTVLNERYGIPFKCDNSDQFMHNKFVVIDNKIVITGSFNWSAGARYKNRENVVITNIPTVVESFATEFEKLWKTF